MLCACLFVFMFFFFKQKTAYEMRISDWSSDVCSSDLLRSPFGLFLFGAGEQHIDSQRDENACRKNDQCTRAIAPQQGQHIDIGDDDSSQVRPAGDKRIPREACEYPDRKSVV